MGKQFFVAQNPAYRLAVLTLLAKAGSVFLWACAANKFI